MNAAITIRLSLLMMLPDGSGGGAGRRRRGVVREDERQAPTDHVNIGELSRFRLKTVCQEVESFENLNFRNRIRVHSENVFFFSKQ